MNVYKQSWGELIVVTCNRDARALRELKRKKDRVGDRVLLDEVLDGCLVGVVSTVLDGQPWSVPMLVCRDGDRVLLHGSTGAGALSHIAAGAPVALTATIVDGIVVSDRQFTHSANYRSAVLRGRCTRVRDEDLAPTLDIFTDSLIAGRSAECPAHSAKELARTVLLELPILEGSWLCKQRSGPPSGGEQGWVGVIPIHQAYGAPVHSSGGQIPPSVQRMINHPAPPGP